ncbi:MAG TPA: type II toxin-antitoxin system PemK/MazF family toxin, partial [Micromonosporaceae bacterium]
MVRRQSHPVAPRGKHLEYAPDLDGQADPGEIVWTWVTFEDDPHQGKDRPVLVVGRDGAKLLGL